MSRIAHRRVVVVQRGIAKALGRGSISVVIESSDASQPVLLAVVRASSIHIASKGCNNGHNRTRVRIQVLIAEGQIEWQIRC